MSTFSYRGINSSKFGCWYVPDENARFNDKADYEVYSNDADWHDGGYYYGNKVKPREFSLTCYYEDIDRKTREKLMAWVDRNTSGRLVFDETPWKYYKVYPTKKVTGKQYTHRYQGQDKYVYSGTFTITFTAYEPWGFMSLSSYDQYSDSIRLEVGQDANIYMNVVDNSGNVYIPEFILSEDKILFVIADNDHEYHINELNEVIMTYEHHGDDVYDWTQIIPESDMPGAPDVNDSSFLVYNCGTEKTYPIIRVGGVSSGDIAISNAVNGTQMLLKGLPENGWLQIDCTQGLVSLVGASTKEVAFSYHDKGFLSLEPCGMLDTDIEIRYRSGQNGSSDVIEILDLTYTGNPVGKYFLLENKWFRVMGKTNDGYAISGKTGKENGSATVSFVTMNQISISGDGVVLNKLEFEFTPRVQ